MNIDQFSHAMNMLGLALPLAFSLVIARIHKRPFFLMVDRQLRGLHGGARPDRAA